VSLLDLPIPDLTILFDLAPSIALKRAQKRSALDRFESEPIDFHERIRSTYLSLSELHSERFKLVDSSKEIIEVQDQVKKILLDYLN
jgi:dTMP kinase